MTCEFRSVIGCNGFYSAFEWRKQVYDCSGEFLCILSLVQFPHEQHIGAPFCECYNCSMPIVSHYSIHFKVSKALAISLGRTFTDTCAVRYGYALSSDRPRPMFEPMTAVLV